MSHLTAKYLAPRLGALVALTPFSVDTYLPAMPAISSQMEATLNQVSITVPLFLIGFALGQLLGGPLSDRFGRKPIAIIGLSIFFVASILMTFADHIDQLYWIRALQAVGGGFATVVASATVRDLFSGKDSARVFSMIALVMLIAPLIAPGIGSLILHFSHWHSIFLFLAFYAALLFALVKFTLPETITPERKQQTRQQPLSRLLSNYKSVLTHKRAIGFLLAQGFASSILFIYISESPFIYMELFKIRPESFPFYFGLVVLGVIFFNRVNIGLLKRYEPRQIVLGVLIAQSFFSFVLIGYEWLFTPNVFVILLLMFFVIGLLGAITPNILASYMDFFPHISGTANALIGSSIFAFGGVMGVVMSELHDGTLQRVSSFTLLMSLISLFSLLLLAKVRQPINIPD
ncbi:multidrug effflux MFS transporter [Hydrogenovibrio sp. JE_KL2]|uniref:multidrug effflux MFS transporter n=1 Tax=Hydrogenovibrio sp. JE_KL2 TaxID=2651188 RepID=UPI00128CF15F|nr:multidrug effflux MFS transporter [Hydrogenovibrio sp. JE_KL2]MPQ76979.1 multidrug effflux MFS transporter [Hydrogenovibrio sp. JE_KL2]